MSGWAVITPLSSAVIGAAGAWLGNYYLRRKVDKRQRDAEALRAMLYAFADLVSRYWAGDHEPTKSSLEWRIISYQHLVVGALSDMSQHSKELRNWYAATESNRMSLLEAASGAQFHQEDWQPDATRIRITSREIAHIVSELNRAC